MPGLVPLRHPMDKAAVRGIGSPLRLVLDFALPPRCPGCGAVVDGDHRFCASCWSALDWLGQGGCVGCGAPMALAGEDARCGGCLASPPRHDGVRAAVAYGAVSAKVAMRLKYGRKPGAATVIARALTRHVDAAGEPLLAPVPLHRWRIWSRGFNQSAIIATRLARATGTECEPALLVRVKPTPPLRGLGRAARARALRGAIAVDPRHRERVSNRNILLVDDVFTSGATANACATALKKAGAASVGVVCWARVVDGDEGG